MLFIRNDGSSHNPEELMKMADFTVAANILVSFWKARFVVWRLKVRDLLGYSRAALR